MPASYPTSAKSFSAKLNGDVIAVGHVTDLEAEVTAVETALVAGLPVTHGGTGVTTRTAYGVIVGGTTATGATQTITPGTSGYLLTSGGASAVPTWAAAATTTPTIQTTTSTGTQADFSTSLSATVHQILLRCNNASLLTITGFTAGGSAPTSGDIVDVVSVNAQVEFDHQTGSTAAYQLTNWVTVGNTPLAANSGTARYIYDGTTTKWRLVAHQQGTWIAQAYSAGNFTSDVGTFTVEAGDVAKNVYWVRGKQLTIQIRLDGWSTTSTPGAIRSAYPGSYLDLGTNYAAIASSARDNGTAINAYVIANATLNWSPLTGSWGNSSNNGTVNCMFTFEIQ